MNIDGFRYGQLLLGRNKDNNILVRVSGCTDGPDPILILETCCHDAKTDKPIGTYAVPPSSIVDDPGDDTNTSHITWSRHGGGRIQLYKYTLMGDDKHLASIYIERKDGEVLLSTGHPEESTPFRVTIAPSHKIYNTEDEALEARQKWIEWLAPETREQLVRYPLEHQIVPGSLEEDVYIYAMHKLMGYVLGPTGYDTKGMRWETTHIAHKNFQAFDNVWISGPRTIYRATIMYINGDTYGIKTKNGALEVPLCRIFATEQEAKDFNDDNITFKANDKVWIATCHGISDAKIVRSIGYTHYMVQTADAKSYKVPVDATFSCFDDAVFGFPTINDGKTAHDIGDKVYFIGPDDKICSATVRTIDDDEYMVHTLDSPPDNYYAVDATDLFCTFDEAQESLEAIDKQ